MKDEERGIFSMTLQLRRINSFPSKRSTRKSIREVTKVGEAPKNFIVWPRRLVDSIGRKGFSQKELFPEPKSQPDTQADILKTLWIAAADITQPKYVFLEVGW
ncbi:hypothetical protein CASFOL_034284 [Castilleja foliolosa]|uniref:Uncharacterized protein n=1 Tax=Castilleja foliolosa TaxID=1961234 RepID=A0ABD3BX69_9LAMI